MLLERIERFINVKYLREDFRKIGINFITAGVVGVFINHFVGTKFSSMFWVSVWITSTGLGLLLLGIVRRDRE